MIPRLENFSVEDHCVHKNDEGNCLLCGTKPIKERVPEPFRTRTPRYVGPWCGQHNCANPCSICYNEQWRDQWLEEQRQEEVTRINAENLKILAASEYAEQTKEAARRAAAAMGVRCWHEIPALDCTICHLADASYNREIYRRQIKEALGVMRTPLDADLVQVIDIAIWQATRRYGPKMNPALARSIAENTAATFQQDVIEEVSVLADFYWDAMGNDFRRDAEALFRSSGETDDARFERLQSMARNRKDEQWKLAKRMIVEYGQRRPRFESLDSPAFEKDDDSTSRAEFEIHQQEAVRQQQAGEIDLEKYRPVLQIAVGRMRGAQKAVGEALLAGKSTREVVGVPQSTAARVRLVVLRIFREEIDTARKC